jgi:hypothetical protein
MRWDGTADPSPLPFRAKDSCCQAGSWVALAGVTYLQGTKAPGRQTDQQQANHSHCTATPGRRLSQTLNGAVKPITLTVQRHREKDRAKHSTVRSN